MTATILRATAGLFAAIAATCCVVTSTAGAQEQQPIAAVLKLREVDFFYRSNRALYPCYRLRNTVANVLLAVGARDDIKVNVSGCEDVTFGDDDAFDRFEDPFDARADRFGNRRADREQMAHVRVRLMMPTPVTPEVLAEIDRDKSRRELVSRVTGNKDFASNDPIIFPALRQTVTLSRKLIKLEPKDCELLDQMTMSVFRELDIRVVRRGGTCDSSTTSRITPQMTVEALMAAQIDQKIPGSAQLEDGAKQDGSAVAPETAAPAPETAPAPAQGEAPAPPGEESQ
jgi:hypothetical protein